MCLLLTAVIYVLITILLYNISVLSCVGVTINGVLEWILDLLTTLTHNS
jgi:hypothetical protein